jgi:hypothetical protein
MEFLTFDATANQSKKSWSGAMLWKFGKIKKERTPMRDVASHECLAFLADAFEHGLI